MFLSPAVLVLQKVMPRNKASFHLHCHRTPFGETYQGSTPVGYCGKTNPPPPHTHTHSSFPEYVPLRDTAFIALVTIFLPFTRGAGISNSLILEKKENGH